MAIFMQIFTKRGPHAPTFLYRIEGCYSMSKFGGGLLCQRVKLVSGTLRDCFRQNSIEHL